MALTQVTYALQAWLFVVPSSNSPAATLLRSPTVGCDDIAPHS